MEMGINSSLINSISYRINRKTASGSQNGWNYWFESNC